MAIQPIPLRPTAVPGAINLDRNTLAPDNIVTIANASGQFAQTTLAELAAYFTELGSAVYLAQYLGFMNVFVTPWGLGAKSFSQQGNFTEAVATDDPNVVNTVGPDIEFPVGKIVRRQWNVHKRLLIYGFNGQSNTVGATSNFAGYNGSVLPFMQLAPLPTKFRCFIGGIEPTQSGVNSDGVTTIIAPQQYQADLVPAHENINTGRDPGKEVNRQTWASAFCQVIANAVSDDNVVLPINVGHGSTNFNQDMQVIVFVSTASWSAGVVTFIFASQTNLAPGDSFSVLGSNPAGYNGNYVALASDGFTVMAALNADPGSYVASGFGLVWAAPMVNLRTMVRYAVNVIAPSLGLLPEFAGFGYQGNESNSALFLVDNFDTQLSTMRSMVNELGVICGNQETPWIVWPQVGFPRSDWHDNDSSSLGCASNVALGLLRAAADPTNKLITYAQYSSVAGGNGDANTVGCIHYGVQGHFYNGERGAGLYLNARIGEGDLLPLQVVEGENLLVRVANSTRIIGSLNRPAVLNTNSYVTNPGNYGYQAYAGVITGGVGFEVDVANIALAGTALTVDLGSLPVSYSNRLGYAYNNATEYQLANNTRIQNATWLAGVAIYTTVAPHGLNPGDTAVVAQMVPTGFNVIPGLGGNTTCQSGTTGSTLVMLVPDDPGVAAIADATWSGGVAVYTSAGAHGMGSDNPHYVTVSGITPSGFNTVGLVTIIDGTHFSIGGVSDPGSPYSSGGTFVGAGAVAVNGIYGVGRHDGLRGNVAESVPPFYSTSTGAPLISWAAIQYASIDVYASMQSIQAALVELGLDTVFQLVLDFGNSTCYDGVADHVTNLGTSGTTDDYYLGTGSGVDARDPTFNGTPGSLNRTNYFSAGADGKIFTPTGTPDILTTAHQAGGQFTIIAGLVVQSAPANNEYQIANCQAEGGSQGPGTAVRVSSSRQWTLLVEGDGGSATYARVAGAVLPANDFALIGCGIKDGDNTSWMYTSSLGATTAAGFETFNPVYSSPSVNPPQSVPMIWQNGNGTVRSRTGLQLQFMLVSNQKVDQAVVLPLMRTLYRHQLLNLPS